MPFEYFCKIFFFRVVILHEFVFLLYLFHCMKIRYNILNANDCNAMYDLSIKFFASSHIYKFMQMSQSLLFENIVKLL